VKTFSSNALINNAQTPSKWANPRRRVKGQTKPTPISWLPLHSQFGTGFEKVRQFKPTMTDALSMALAVYPKAEVSIGQDGVTLFPSPSAIPKPEARRLGIL
jgi:hypothetical protein